MATKTTILSIRRAYRGLPETAAKQMGLRKLRDALALGDRNPARVAELIGWARYHLPYAEAARC